MATGPEIPAVHLLFQPTVLVKGYSKILVLTWNGDYQLLVFGLVLFSDW